jgi:gamma-glutamyltranspeptidase/glutathione hydrolase/leukotriene-C4 hydrolase
MLNNTDWRAIFAPQGRLLREGEMIYRTNLSHTLATIAQQGADAIYKAGIKFLSAFFLLTCVRG